MKKCLVLMLLLGLSACNGTEQAQGLNSDWVDGTTVGNDTTVPEPQPTSTATPPATAVPSDLYTGPESVAKYVEKFLSDALLQGKDVSGELSKPKLEIQIASLDAYGSSTIGLCETSSNRRRVTFDPDFWNSASETQRELLAHHELGHCVLHRSHRSDLLSTGKYASIMYPIIMTSSAYTSNYDYYQSELFNFETLEVGDPNVSNVHICNGL